MGPLVLFPVCSRIEDALYRVLEFSGGEKLDAKWERDFLRCLVFAALPF